MISVKFISQQYSQTIVIFTRILKLFAMKGESIFALLAGAAIGAALGVLFAPDKGEETRKKMKKAAEDVYGKVKDNTSNVRDELNSLRDILAETGNELKEGARVKALEQLKKLEQALAKNENQGVDPNIDDKQSETV